MVFSNTEKTNYSGIFLSIVLKTFFYNDIIIFEG